MPLRKAFSSVQLPGGLLPLSLAHCITVITVPAPLPELHTALPHVTRTELLLRLLLLLRVLQDPGASVMSALLRQSSPIPCFSPSIILQLIT